MSEAVQASETPPFDPALPWRLSPKVAIRPESFGALLYHFGNRKLSFLKAPSLVSLVQILDQHPSVSAALDASQIPPDQHSAHLSALGSLARSDIIIPEVIDDHVA
jgi:putative mycofactocin binding protein MftB